MLESYEARIAPVMEIGIRLGSGTRAFHAITSTMLAARRVECMPVSSFHFPFNSGQAAMQRNKAARASRRGPMFACIKDKESGTDRRIPGGDNAR
ncbi:hypothetical protein [Burkholderia sp. BCC1977]|uniref:hypothetical protein n=1 Tax=Burkholderia sp. BCC1977 TaxID=2817440 RepID=UPI002ABE6A13|nr:hypothetical protein [Burkholderia sp. BCC1977]